MKSEFRFQTNYFVSACLYDLIAQPIKRWWSFVSIIVSWLSSPTIYSREPFRCIPVPKFCGTYCWAMSQMPYCLWSGLYWYECLHKFGYALYLRWGKIQRRDIGPPWNIGQLFLFPFRKDFEKRSSDRFTNSFHSLHKIYRRLLFFLALFDKKILEL